MNELSSVRWTRFADVLTRFASEFPKNLEEIQAEHKVRTEIEQQRNRLLQEQIYSPARVRPSPLVGASSGSIFILQTFYERKEKENNETLSPEHYRG